MKLTAPWVVLLLFGSLVGGIVLIALHEAVLGASIVTPTLLLIGEVVRSQIVQIKEAKKKTATQTESEEPK